MVSSTLSRKLMLLKSNRILDEVFEVSCVDSGGFHCSSCNVYFENVDEHLKEHHQKDVEDEGSCKVDDDVIEEYVEAEGMAFVIKNADGKFECQVKDCSRTYKTLRRFLDHVKTHGSVTPSSVKKLEEFLKQLEDNDDIFELIGGNFKCRVCNTLFDCRKKMLLHYPIHQNVARAQRKRLPDASDSLHCRLCNRSMNDEYELKLHMKAHEENQAQATSSGTAAPKKAEKILQNDGKSTYPCQYCQKLFKRPHEKVKHER